MNHAPSPAGAQPAHPGGHGSAHQGVRTGPLTSDVLDPLALFEHPARLGTLGAQARQRAFGDEVWVRPTPPHPMPEVALKLRDDQAHALPAWPAPPSLAAGDRLVLEVPATPAGRERWVTWLRALAAA
ncbi:MAG: hypothetical protein KDK70_29470, partial [Myxococcales bacterium]|nr:hypothetical protein [Myxococcales bacterium]